MEITHDEAVNLLKYHKRMTILIRDVGKIPHSCSSLDHPQSSSSWHAGDSTSHYGININNLKKKNSTTLTIEDKARALLSRHSFSNLLYYLTEYGAKGMTVEAFVSILLELLDTPEKVSKLLNIYIVYIMHIHVMFVGFVPKCLSYYDASLQRKKLEH